MEPRWANGTPVTDATVFEGPLGLSAFRQTGLTNATGHVTVRGISGEAQTLYVLRPGVARPGPCRHRTRGSRHDSTARRDAAHRLAERKADRVRDAFDGDIIPDDILQIRYGYRLPYTGEGELVIDRLPAGFYEIWLAGLRPQSAGAPPPLPCARATGGDTPVSEEHFLAAARDYFPSRDVELLEYMELLAVFEASSRRLLPPQVRQHDGRGARHAHAPVARTGGRAALTRAHIALIRPGMG